MKTIFLRVLDASNKAAALQAAILDHDDGGNENRFEVDITTFSVVPQSPFAYWIDDRLRNLFKELPSFATEERTARVGLQSNDDFRWLRTWWETLPGHASEAYVVPLAKGGANSPFYADLHTGIRWGKEGNLIKAWKADQLEKNLITANNSKCWNEGYYFRPGLTWPHRSATFSAAALPAGCVFGQSGKTAFAPETQLRTLLGLFNSSLMTLLARVQSDAVRIKFEVGLIQNIPLNVKVFADSRLAVLGQRGWSLKRSIDTTVELSHAFALPALLQVKGNTLAARIVAWDERISCIETELSLVRSAIDRHAFDIYGVTSVDRDFSVPCDIQLDDESGGTGESGLDVDSELEAHEDSGEANDAGTLGADLVSWAVGVAFGRFDIQLATGARNLPQEPDPFDSLPQCSPAMLTGADDFPLASAPTGYSVPFPEDGILVDDPGHVADITATIRIVFDEVFISHADTWWSDVGALVDPKDRDLRAWIKSSFLEYHLKRYSKSRRKAPIYWQLAVPSSGYSVWLYAHRLTRDTFFHLQTDVVNHKVEHEERQLADLNQQAGPNPLANTRKEISAQKAFVEELRAMLDEIRRVAPLWNPNLDDGVVLTMAPLWRLVPQHKAWQKELRKRWEELAAGNYDWAHIAMHLWPERVVPKCTTDRSLAIAHGLGDVFWEQDQDGKWQPRLTPTVPVDKLVRERTSPAVKAALKAMLEAPSAGLSASRTHRRAEASS